MLFVSHKCYGRHVTADHPRKFSIEFLPGLTVDAACRVTIRRVDGTRDEPPYSEVLRVTLESVSWEGEE